MGAALKFLVVGLGSMGKRRVRNLRALGYAGVAGFDPRQDRVAEAVEKYSISPFGNFDAALEQFRPDALVISTPPRHHMTYAEAGFERGLPCFIEASVTEPDRILKLHQRAEKTPVLIAPSCTMRFYPGPRKVKELIGAGAIGRPLNINYHTGQWLPDWHPWEDIRDYYVSERESGAAREIVPFELTWLNDIFGAAEPLACAKAKLSDMAADIDDIYHCLLRYPAGVLASVTVEVLSRPRAARELNVIGTEGRLVFSGDENCVRYSSLEHPEWVRFDLGKGSVEKGYVNPEEPYVEELGRFIQAVESGRKAHYPHTLIDDAMILKTLCRLEELSGSAT